MRDDRRPRFREALATAGFLCALPATVIEIGPGETLDTLVLWAFATLVFGLMAQAFAQSAYSGGFKDGAQAGSANPALYKIEGALD